MSQVPSNASLFTPQAAQKIATATNIVLGTAIDQTSPQTPRNPNGNGFWAQIVAQQTPTTPTAFYSVKKMQPNAASGTGMLVDDVAAYDTGGYFRAYEVNGNTAVAPFTNIWLTYAGTASYTDGSGSEQHPTYLFSMAPSGQTFRVNLVQTGGTGGDATHAPSWTYSAYDLTNAITFGTGLSPEWAARCYGAFDPAGAGLGYYYYSTLGLGGFVLSIAFETPLANLCGTYSG